MNAPYETVTDLTCKFCDKPAARTYAGVPICAEPSTCRARLGPPVPPDVHHNHRIPEPVVIFSREQGLALLKAARSHDPAAIITGCDCPLCSALRTLADLQSAS